MSKLIVMLDDEPDILKVVSFQLINAGFKVKGFAEFNDFIKCIKKEPPDLILLDLMLPESDGLEICKSLKRDDKFAMIPIIMLTAKDEEIDKVLGLEIGADDYVTKPFSSKELLARIKAVLRRYSNLSESRRIAIDKKLLIDAEKFEVNYEGKKIELTPTEFKILELLAKRRGHVFTRDRILDSVWGSEKIIVDRAIDVHIRHLREKLGKASYYIKNIRGVGYKMIEN